MTDKKIKVTKIKNRNRHLEMVVTDFVFKA